VVVEDINAEEQNNVDKPSTYGDFIGPEEEGRPADVELGNISGCRNKDELDECKKSPTVWMYAGGNVSGAKR
jgi:hypothetical protein